MTLVVCREVRARYTGTLQLERSYETIRARVEIKTGLHGPVDVLWIAVKGHQLLPALSAVSRSGSIGAVVPLLNGIEHVAALRSFFTDGQVVPAAILVSSERVAPEQFVQRSPFANLMIASMGEERLGRVRTGLEAAGFTVEFAADEKTMLWRKLAFLAPLALVGAASGKDKQGIFGDAAWRNRLEAAVAEVCEVAVADGGRVHRMEIFFDTWCVASCDAKSNAEGLVGLEAEVDAIGGAIIRAGKRYEIGVPVIEELVREIAGRSRGLV